jgi:hypothetical protein
LKETTMKKQTHYLLITLLLLSLLFTACSGAVSTSVTEGATSQTQNPSGDNSLPLPTRLAIGTLRLEDTNLAVTAEQAVELLTLWKAYRAVSTGETVATAELEAVIRQIQDTMTPEQIQAIEAMNLTRQEMVEVLQSLGIETGARPEAQGTPSAGQSFPGGEPPGGGGFMPGEGFGGPGMSAPGTLTPSLQATLQARFNSQATRVSSVLLDALIKLLESKSQPSQ